ARREHLAHAGYRSDARRDPLIDEIAQRIRVRAARHVDDHREAAERREILRRDVDERTLGLRPRELRGDARELELAHADVRAAVELEGQPAARAVDLAPRFLEP